MTHRQFSAIQQLFPERPRGLNDQGAQGGSMRSFGHRDPWALDHGTAGSQEALPHNLNRRQGAGNVKTQTNKQQQRNNNNNPISCRLPAGYLEGGSPQLPSSTPPPFIA
jgi:hypothetical protein